MLTLKKLEKAGFTVDVIPRIDMKPRDLFEVTLTRKCGAWVSLLANRDLVENRMSILYDNLVHKFHYEIEPVKSIGRGDLRMTSYYDI